MNLPWPQMLKESICKVGGLGLILDWEDPLRNEMASHSSILSWRIPQTVEPGCLQSMGLQRVGHDWATKHAAGTRWGGKHDHFGAEQVCLRIICQLLWDFLPELKQMCSNNLSSLKTNSKQWLGGPTYGLNETESGLSTYLLLGITRDWHFLQ